MLKAVLLLSIMQGQIQDMGREIVGFGRLVPLEASDRLQIILELECGPMPNVMAALPNIGGAPCSMPQCLADAHY